MYCPKCGNKIENKSAKYCTKCGNTINCKQNNNPNNLNLIILISFIIFIFFTASTLIYFCYSKTNELYQIKTNNEAIFINEKGKEVFRLSLNEYPYIGEFSDGLLFVGQQIAILDPFEGTNIGKLFVFNTKGKIVNEFPDYVILQRDCEYDDIILPKFINSVVEILLLENNETIYLNKDFKKITKEEYEAINNNDKTYKNLYDTNLRPFRPDLVDTNSPIPYINNKNKISYMLNNKIVIDSIGDIPLGSGDLSRDPYFYNGIAMVFQGFTDPQRRFINRKGEFINNEVYDWAEPFYRKLSYVSQTLKDGSTKRGYINRKGKYVWSIVEKEEVSQNSDSSANKENIMEQSNQLNNNVKKETKKSAKINVKQATNTNKQVTQNEHINNRINTDLDEFMN